MCSSGKVLGLKSAERFRFNVAREETLIGAARRDIIEPSLKRATATPEGWVSLTRRLKGFVKIF